METKEEDCMSLTRKDTMSLFHELSDTLIKKIESHLTKIMDQKFTSVYKKLDEIRNVANEANIKAKWSETQINNMKEKYDDEIKEIKDQNKHLQTNNTILSTKLECNVMKIHVMQTRLEDQINRSCRKSLVIKGVPEEFEGKETWSQTKTILSKEISKVIPEIQENEAYNMIERCHRSAPNIKKRGRRDIFAGFYKWEDSNHIERSFQIASRKKETGGIFIEQKYGVDTTTRRNMALLERKNLKIQKTITAGYVSYPAKLYVKYRDDTKYILFKDFSEEEIGTIPISRRKEDNKY